MWDRCVRSDPPHPTGRDTAVTANRSAQLGQAARDDDGDGRPGDGSSFPCFPDDLPTRIPARWLVRDHPGLTVGRLLRTGSSLSSRLAGRTNVLGAERVTGLDPLPPIVIATAAKWARVKEEDGHWPLAIVDEAYQMRCAALLACAGLFDSALFVGDPGQLDPFSSVKTDRWTGLTWNPLRNAVDVTLAHNPT